MKIFEYSENIRVDFSASVIALGLFDGVHKGHRALLTSAKKEAEKRSLPLAVFTFYSENRLPKGTTRLYSTDIKNKLLERMGAEYVIYADFETISDVQPEIFVRDILIKKLKASLAVTGLDFKFGKGRSGDAKLLSALMKDGGGECLLVPDEILFGKKISTSFIKELLSSGEPKLAAQFLGEPYFIEGEIIHGDGRGETLGLPTVNISLQKDKHFLKKGVYSTQIVIDEKIYTGLTNLGKCPTFEERDFHAETFILDFSKNVYGKHARIFLLDYLREEKRFGSREELTEQIQKDIETVKARYQNGR